MTQQIGSLDHSHYSNFINSIRAEATRRSYQHYFKKYSEYMNGNILCNGDIRLIEQNIIDFLLSLKSKDSSSQNIKCNFVAINHFYEMNDINLNRKKISRFIQSDKRKRSKNQGYTSEQIHKLLDVCDERTKAIVLIYASTGMRLGGLPSIKIGDLRPIKREDFETYEIAVYQGYNEEYVTFCTPECAKVINSYLSYRARCGEKLTDNSPLIREQFASYDPFKVNYAKPITLQTIAKTLRDRLVQAGIREIVHTGNSSGAKIRKDVQLVHGFRKFFNTALMNADVAYAFKELLMGHSIKLDDFYYDKDSKHSRQKLLDEYIKAINNLTINEENRLRMKVQQLTIRADQIMELRFELDKLKRKINPEK